jgi:hypothetical protein
MNELNEFIDGLKGFVIDRVDDITERNQEIAKEILNTGDESKVGKLNTEMKGLSGELSGYTQIYGFINDKGLI